MERSREDIRKGIIAKYIEDKNISTKDLALSVGTSVWTVRRTIKRFIEAGTVAEKPKSGRPRGTTDKNVERKVLRQLDNFPTRSIRDMGRVAGTSHTTVQRVKKNYNYKTYKKQKTPKRTEKQEKNALRRSRKFYYQILIGFKGCIVMDDETYVKADFRTLPGPQFYTTQDQKDADDEIKSISMEKYGEKFLVWQAICQCGKRSRPFVTKEPINSEIYIKECLKKRLVPFLRDHTTSTLFWPDLATSHYSAKTLEFFEQNNINFVPKDMNPPNCPELRPIERYWALIKRVLRNEAGAATSPQDFQSKWNRAAKKIDDVTVQNIMRHIKSKVRRFSRKNKI